MDYNHSYGAGFRHGQVKVAGGTVYDIDAVIGIDADPESEQTDIPGDDTIKATFTHGQKEKLTITANAISMDVLAAVTGNEVKDISATPGPAGKEIAGGTDKESNAPFVELTGVISGKTDKGTSVTITRVWHRVQVNTVKIDSSNGKEMAVTMSATAFKTGNDITNSPLSPARIYSLKVQKEA